VVETTSTRSKGPQYGTILLSPLEAVIMTNDYECLVNAGNLDVAHEAQLGVGGLTFDTLVDVAFAMV
jgi:hypothetical protein